MPPMSQGHPDFREWLVRPNLGKLFEASSNRNGQIKMQFQNNKTRNHCYSRPLSLGRPALGRRDSGTHPMKSRCTELSGFAGLEDRRPGAAWPDTCLTTRLT